MKARTTLAAIVAASLLAVPALAAPGNANGKAHSAQRAKKRAGKMTPAQREARALAKLKKAGIDEARAKRVIAINKHYRAEKKKLRAASKTHRQAIRKLLQSKSTDEAAFKVALDNLHVNRTKARALGDSRVAALRTILKPSDKPRSCADCTKPRRTRKLARARTLARASAASSGSSARKALRP